MKTQTVKCLSVYENPDSQVSVYEREPRQSNVSLYYENPDSEVSVYENPDSQVSVYEREPRQSSVCLNMRTQTVQCLSIYEREPRQLTALSGGNSNMEISFLRVTGNTVLANKYLSFYRPSHSAGFTGHRFPLNSAAVHPRPTRATKG